MIAASSPLAKKTAEVAFRLRTVQSSFADETPERRHEYMEEALARELNDVLPDQRVVFLEALRDFFPAWENGAAAPAAAPESESEVEPESSTEDILSRFFELAQLMEGDEREALLSRLRQEGLASANRRAEPAAPAAADAVALPDGPAKALQFLMRRLNVDRLELTRTLKMMALLADMVGVLDQLVWSTWRVVAPNSGVRRPCDLRKEMVRYVSGDRDVRGVAMKEATESLRRMMAALIAGVGQAGGQFARSHLARFAPQAIETEVEMERGGLLLTREFKCWNRYVELSKELDAMSIEHAIKQAIASCTEAMLARAASRKEGP